VQWLSFFFFRKSCRLWDNVEKCGRFGDDTDVNIIRRMRFACQITKGTHTLSLSQNMKYVLLFHDKSGYANAPECYFYTYTAYLFSLMSLALIVKCGTIIECGRNIWCGGDSVSHMCIKFTVLYCFKYWSHWKVAYWNLYRRLKKHFMASAFMFLYFIRYSELAFGIGWNGYRDAPELSLTRETMSFWKELF
jgi:hypothetical protein